VGKVGVKVGGIGVEVKVSMGVGARDPLKRIAIRPAKRPHAHPIPKSPIAPAK